jgi:hypothetical protein
MFTELLSKLFQDSYESRNADDKYFCVVAAMLVVVVVMVS